MMPAWLNPCWAFFVQCALGVEATQTTSLQGLQLRPIEVPIGNIERGVTVFEVDDNKWWAASTAEHNPYGMKLWPAALGCAHRLAKIAEVRGGTLKGLHVLELGAGNGLCSLVAAALGASSVVATDISVEALDLIEKGATQNQLRVAEGPSSPGLSTMLFDVCDMASPLPSADLVIAADLLYEKALSVGTARRVNEAALRGSMVLVGTDPSRVCRGDFLTEIQRLAAAANSKGHASNASSQLNGKTSSASGTGFTEPPSQQSISCSSAESSSLTWPLAPEHPFFEPSVTVALEPVKWKAKQVELALLHSQ